MGNLNYKRKTKYDLINNLLNISMQLKHSLIKVIINMAKNKQIDESENSALVERKLF